MTLRKAANAARVLGSYHYSRHRSKAHMRGLPFSISIEPTTSCNLRCPECPSGLRSFTRPTGMMETGLFQKVIHDIEEHLIYLLLYFQGEPYLNPQFLDLASYASSRGIYTATSTNAHYLTEDNAKATVQSGLDRLIISIDGTTQDTYEQYRIGGSLERVIEGTRNLVEWKRKLKSLTPEVVFQFLVVKPNEHQVNEVLDLAKVLGVDNVQFKTAQIYDFEQGSELIPENDRYSRYRQHEDGTYSLKNDLLDQCWKMWHSCVVTWDGQVVPCCFDKDAHHTMGSLRDASFKSIWHSDQYDNFRNAILTSRSSIDICRNCSEGTRVWA